MPEEHVNYTVYIGVSQGRNRLYAMMKNVLQKPHDVLLDEATKHWRRWLSKKRILELSVLDNKQPSQQAICDIYNRSLLCLNLLGDPQSGAFIAAPEFDPDFEMCGGYGFCWNRDCAEVVLALLGAGYPEYCEMFAGWCKQTQMPDGSWFQRYWLGGQEAPSWGNFDDSTQIDETGATLHGIDRYYRSLGEEMNEFLQDKRETILRGADYLLTRSKQGMSDPCRGLWEAETGIFSYTNAAIYAGLMGAAHMAKDCGEQRFADRCLERADLIKKNTIEQMWLGKGYFAKGIIDGRIDISVDASMLGTFIPFNMLSPRKPQERAMILSMINNIETKLGVYVNDHSGIKRYESDNYIGGNPWVVTTLWLSGALLNLAKESTTRERDVLVNRALEYIMWSVRGATPTGLLPEQVDRQTGKPAWAIPLSWSCALMIENTLLLDELDSF
jgi:oligosaccharide amylase